MSDTIKYYNDNAKAFIDRTVNADIVKAQDCFLSLVPEGGHVLDAGCGSGRDSLYFLQKGFRVTSFDASIEMVEFSSKLTGQKSIHATFQDIKLEKEVFDGIWACASLLHVDKNEIADVMEKMFCALKRNGVFYIALKYGNKDYVKDGRNFYIYNENSISDILSKIDNYEVVNETITQDRRKDMKNQKWINLIIKKV